MPWNLKTKFSHPSLQNASLITFESVEIGFSEGKQWNHILYLRNPNIQGRGYQNINKLNKFNITQSSTFRSH